MSQPLEAMDNPKLALLVEKFHHSVAAQQRDHCQPSYFPAQN
jgi:hypothetical protein